jgi:hypothetical protein
VTALPRPAGPNPFDDETLAAIRDAFVAAFDRRDPTACEEPGDAAQLDGVGAGFGTFARTLVVKVRRVSDDRAEIEFAFVLGPEARGTVRLEGVAVMRDRRWQVGAETTAQVLRLAGGGGPSAEPEPGPEG